MSDPFVVIAAGLQAAGTIAKGNAAAKPSKLQAELLRRQAERAKQVATARAEQIRRQRSRKDARLRARLYASGIDAGSGSALLSLESRAGDAELAALTEINEGHYQSEILDRKAGLSNFRGEQMKLDSRRKAASTFLLAVT